MNLPPRREGKGRGRVDWASWRAAWTRQEGSPTAETVVRPAAPRAPGAALVIGGTGFVGTAIVRELVAAGWRVATLGRGNQPNRVPEAETIVADRAEPGALAAATAGRRFDLVVDCAAYRAPDVEDAVAAFAGRIGHYVFISTTFVYSSEIEGPFPIAEEAPKERALPYGVGKLAGEAALATAWDERRFPFTALRSPYVIGAGKPIGTGSIQWRDPELIEHMRAGTDLTLVAEGLPLVQPVWNREIGRCIAHLAGRERAFGQIANIAGPEIVTVRRFYQGVAEQLGIPLRYETIGRSEYLEKWPEMAPHVCHRVYDLTRLHDVTGYRPSLSLADAIADSLAWYEERGV